MPKARVTTKGQVTVPKEVRDRLGIRPGDEIEFSEEGRGYLVRKRIAASPFRKYRGYLKHLAGRDPDDVIEQMRGR
jgi:AbrB family looped-hinge helix DNA binding protein